MIKSGTAPVTDKLATAPTAKSGLKYTGSTQTGVPAGTGYTISGNTAKDAGNYQATVTLASGYKWSDGLASASRTVSWSIAKGANAWTENPSVTPSSWTAGSAPASIAFSNGANKFGAAVSCDTSAAVLKALAGGESMVHVHGRGERELGRDHAQGHGERREAGRGTRSDADDR